MKVHWALLVQLGFCVNSFRLIRLFSKISKIEEKNNNLQMVTHLSTGKAHGCLTLLIWPFTLTALAFGSCLILCKCSPFQGWVEQLTLTFFQRDNGIPYMNASIKAQHRHDKDTTQNMFVFTCVCIVFICVCVCLYMCLCLNVIVFMFIFTCVCVCFYICMCLYVFMFMFKCVCVCVYVYV